MTKDGRFGILSRKHALELKEAMFGATTGIFIDRSVSELAQNYKRYTSLVEDGKNFIRIDERDSHRRVTPRDRVLVPGYALEFLDLDPDSGTITGVKNTNKLFMWFAMNGEIDTDFLHKTRFRLNSADIGKLNLVENAMKTLRTSNDLITVQNIRRPIHEQGKERRIRRTPGHMKFSCPVGISFTLYANGRASDVVIGSGRPNALCKAALSQPEDIDLIYRGRNYSLGF